MPNSTFTHRWDEIFERAGIRRVNFHATRHTAVTQALEDGQQPHVVAAMLGDASADTTLRLYAHVTPVSTAALVASIDARYRPPLSVIAGAVRGTDGGTDREAEATQGLSVPGKGIETVRPTFETAT